MVKRNFLDLFSLSLSPKKKNNASFFLPERLRALVKLFRATPFANHAHIPKGTLLPLIKANFFMVQLQRQCQADSDILN